MRFIRPLSRRAYVLLGTMLAILGLILGYFIFYLPNREENIIEQKSRILTQVARNFEKKWEVFEKNAGKMVETKDDAIFPLKVTLIPKATKKDTFTTKSESELSRALSKIKITPDLSIQVKQKLDSISFFNVPPHEIIQKLHEESFKLNDSIELIISVENSFREKNIILDLLSENEKLELSIFSIANNLSNSLKRFDKISLSFKNDSSKELPVSFISTKVQEVQTLRNEVIEFLRDYITYYKETQFQKDFSSKGYNSFLEISFDKPKKNPFTFFHYQKKEQEPEQEQKPAEGLNIKEFHISVQPELFISPLLEMEDFDGYFLYYDHENPSESPGTEEGPVIIFQSLPGELFAEQIYTTSKTDKEDKSEVIVSHALYSPKLNRGTILNAQLNGKAYKLLETTIQTVDYNQNNIKWHLIGLIEKENFEKERRSVPPILVVTYSLALLLILFGLPQLKLLFMSRIEQLSTSNFVLSCLSAVLCTSLLIIILLGLNTYSIHETNRIDKSLQTLANRLDEALKAETEAMYHAAVSYDSIDSLTLFPVGNSVNSISLISQNQAKQIKKKILKKFWFSDFDFLFWINDQGKIVRELSTTQTKDYYNSLDLKERPYYQEVLKKAAWKKPDQKEFYIQSIQSWDKGEKSCVLSIKSSQTGAVVLGFQKQLQSLFNTILPPAYEFHIIDQTGLVLFHSNEYRNLQENFLSECHYNSGITAAMVSNTALFTDHYYKHRKNRAYIKPLSGVPWYLIVSYDNRFSTIPLSLIVAYTLISSVLIAITLSILFLITTRINRHPSRLAKSKVNISWLRPREANRELYSKAVHVHLATIFLLIAYNLFDEVISYQSFTIFLATVSILYTTLYFKLRKKNRMDISALLCLSVPIIILFVQWFLYEVSLYEFTYLALFLFILYTFFFKDKASEIKKVEHKPYGSWTTMRWVTKWIEGADFRDSYSRVLFTFLIITAVLPATFLFSKIYQEEQLIWKKHALYELNKKVLNRENTLQQKFQIFEASTGSEATELIKTKLKQAWLGKGAYYMADGYEVRDCQGITCHPEEPANNPFSFSYQHIVKDGRSDHYLLSVFQKARPKIAGLVTETDGFLLNQGYNAKWSQVYQRMTEASGNKNRVHIHMNNQPTHPSHRTIAGPVPTLFTDDSIISNFFLASALFAFLFLVFRALKYMLKTYFSWHLFTLSERIAKSDDLFIDKEFKKKSKEIPDKKASSETTNKKKKVFFVTSPYSSHKSYDGYEPINLVQLDSPAEWNKIQKELKILNNKLKYSNDKPQILLQNFSYNPQSIEAWNKKLILLEKLLSSEKEIAIQSNFRPLQIFEVYEKQILKLEHGKDKNGSAYENSSFRTVEELNEALSRWKDILSSFFKVFVTPTKGQYKKKAEPEKTLIESEIECLLENEMAAWPDYFSWIPGYEKILLSQASEQIKKLQEKNDHERQDNDEENLKVITEIKEEIILKIQSMAQSFYFSLWNNCSMEEKYVLYDLAKDGFINPRSRNLVYLLMEKGLVYQDENDQLHIRNKSFRNFILTNIKKSEAIEIERYVTQTGTYSIMKAAVIIVAVASLGFIAFTNQGHVENLIALLSGLAAIIPMFFRFSGWFSTGESMKA